MKLLMVVLNVVPLPLPFTGVQLLKNVYDTSPGKSPPIGYLIPSDQSWDYVHKSNIIHT